MTATITQLVRHADVLIEIKKTGKTIIESDAPLFAKLEKQTNELRKAAKQAEFKKRKDDELPPAVAARLRKLGQQQIKKEVPQMHPALSKASQDAEAARLRKRDPRMSERMARHRAMGKALYDAGLYGQMCLHSSTALAKARTDELDDAALEDTEKFSNIVASLVKGGMKRAAAMAKARRENPQAFAAYQRA